jgi:hypothetical protein
MVAARVDALPATPEDGMRGSHEGPEPDAPQARDRTPPRADAGTNPTLRRAAAGWLRRGYVVRYEDPHLIQLVRAGRPTWQGMLLIAFAIPFMALSILLVIRGLRQRMWHTISIARTPDDRIVTHMQWAPSPPEEP